MSQFAVGDRVRITGRFGNDKGFATVVKVLKTRIITDDGFRYDHDGYRISGLTGRANLLGSSIRKVDAS